MHEAAGMSLCALVYTYQKDFRMTSREMLLGMAKLHQQRGERIPADMLAEAERLGLSLMIFNEPTNQVNDEGEIIDGE